MRALPLLLLACAEADPCPAMCVAAADTYGECLETQDLDWSAAGYADRRDFIDACETWAWEQRVLEEAEDAPGRTDRACRQRTQTLHQGAPPCETYAALGWSDPLSGS